MCWGRILAPNTHKARGIGKEVLPPGGKLDLTSPDLTSPEFKMLATESEFEEHPERAKLNTFVGGNQLARVNE